MKFNAKFVLRSNEIKNFHKKYLKKIEREN